MLIIRTGMHTSAKSIARNVKRFVTGSGKQSGQETSGERLLLQAAAEQAAEERERLQLRRAESRELTLQRQKNKVMEQEIAALQAYIVKLRELT